MEEIIKINAYLDGGTVKITTTKQEYYIDSRIRTKTKGHIFFSYPEKNNENIQSNQQELKKHIKDLVDKYQPSESIKFDWKPKIYNLLEK